MGITTKYEILIGYTMFLSLYFTISVGIGYTSLTGNLPIIKKPSCSFGLIGIDGAFDCVYQYLQPLLILFDISTSIGILNSMIVIPYLTFVLYLFIEMIRGVD